MPEVSILIVNWNTRELTEKAIDSLFRHEKSIDFEIILVDNASADGSVGYLSDRFPNIQIIANSQNSGFAKANNQAAARARGTYLLLFNSDAWIEGEILPACVETMRSQGPCLLGCKLLNPDGSLQISTGRFPTVADYLVESFASRHVADRANLRRQAGLGSKPGKVDWLTGAFLMAERETYLRLGGLSEGIFMYGEDMEFCHRAGKAGAPCVYLPAVSAKHLGGASADYTSMRFIVLTDTGRLRTFAAMRGSRAALLLRGVFILRSALRSVLYLMLLPVGKGFRAKLSIHFTEVLILAGIRDARHFI